MARTKVYQVQENTNNLHGTVNKQSNQHVIENNQSIHHVTANKTDNKAGTIDSNMKFTNNKTKNCDSNSYQTGKSFQPMAQRHAPTKISPYQILPNQGQSKYSHQGGLQNVYTEVYRATTVQAHPDVGFESGAWLFDSTAAPQWLQSQLPSSNTDRAQRYANNQASAMTSQKHAKPSSMPLHQSHPDSERSRNANPQVYRATTVQSHPDVGFESGAWLFDRSAAPQWLESQLPPKVHSSHQIKKNGVQKQSVSGHTLMHSTFVHTADQSSHKPVYSKNYLAKYTDTQIKNTIQPNNSGTFGPMQNETMGNVEFQSRTISPRQMTQLPKTNQIDNNFHIDNRTKSHSPQHRRDDAYMTDHAKPKTMHSHQSQSRSTQHHRDDANMIDHTKFNTMRNNHSQSSKSMPNYSPMMSHPRTTNNNQIQECFEENDWRLVSYKNSYCHMKLSNRVISKPYGNTLISNHMIPSDADIDWENAMDWTSAINQSSFRS